MADFDAFLPRLTQLLDRLEAPAAAPLDWKHVRGRGKSSLAKAAHAKYAPKGLRPIEVDKAGLQDTCLASARHWAESPGARAGDRCGRAAWQCARDWADRQ